MLNDNPEPVDVYVGQKIRAERKLAGFSQARLASRIGVSFQQLQKYENAANRVSASMLVAIADTIGCRPVDLLPPTGGQVQANLVDQVVAAAYGLELNETFFKLSHRDRRVLIGVARVLASPPDVPETAAK